MSYEHYGWLMELFGREGEGRSEMVSTIIGTCI